MRSASCFGVVGFDFGRHTEEHLHEVFSAKPMIEIALLSGYESQQVFTDIFSAMYKTSPAEFRETENFYPLQLEIYLKEEPVKMDLTKADIF